MLKKWWHYQRSEWLVKYQARFAVQPLIFSQHDIQQWFSTDLGQRILNEQKTCVDELLVDLFGYHLMRLSVINNVDWGASSPVRHHFSLTPELSNEGVGAVAEFEHLPIDSDSIDVAILHHALDFSLKPHQVLRETARAIIPNGYIVLVGFNPHSFLGWTQPIVKYFSRSAIFRRQRLRVSRLHDWCKVLGLEIVYSKKMDYGLPIQKYHGSFLNRIGQLLYPGLGNTYVLVLRKNVTPMRMIKVEWKKEKRIAKWGKGMVSPASSTSASQSRKVTIK